MTCCLRGMGLAVPEHSISQSEAADLIKRFNADSDEQARTLQVLYRRAGVRRRGSVILEASEPGVVQRQSFYPARDEQPLGPTTAARMQSYEHHAGGLAVAASLRAFEASGLAPTDITHLVTVSCSGFHAPGFDIELLQSVGLSPGVARTHIGFMGCHGALNGLRVADAFLQADPRACVLLCCVELCSLHHQYGWSPDRIVSNALFADGAASVVLTHSAPDAANVSWRLRASGSIVLPETTADMGWRIRDHGFEMTLSARVPDLIQQHLRPWLSDWLGSLGLRLEEVGSWAIHPGGPRILSAAGEALGLRREQWGASEAILAEHGNMSSPTILFILDRLRHEAATGRCVALAFGPGLTIEAALLE